MQSRLNHPLSLIGLVLLLGTLSTTLVFSPSWASKGPEGKNNAGPYDFYLTNNRICRKCISESHSPGWVQLTNQQGISALYPETAIIGVKNKPFWQGLYRHHLKELGMPAKILVPEAFESEERLAFPDPPYRR